ncbi:MAG TPA: hypothetical protein VF094_11850 [Gaiellaceae bacterium]
MARALLLIALLGAALGLAAAASAAAPNCILVDGHGLSHPVLLANWRQNLKILLAVGSAPPARGPAVASLRTRARFDLAEFWDWRGRPRPTSPAQASQHGSFYPAHGRTPAIVVLQVQGIVVPRIAPAFLLTLLARSGVPTRV